MFRAVLLSIIRSLLTVHSAMVYHTCLKTAFEQVQDGTAVPFRSCSKAVYKPVWHIPLPSVQWINSLWWAEELPETCRISCRSKFVKLVYLVGFIIKTIALGTIVLIFFFNCGFCWSTKPKHFTCNKPKTIKILSKQSKFIILTSQWSAFLAEEGDK